MVPGYTVPDEIFKRDLQHIYNTVCVVAEAAETPGGHDSEYGIEHAGV